MPVPKRWTKDSVATLGFTLVELVMIMVVIGLLAAIVVPRYATQRENAKKAVTQANLETLRTAINLYYAKNGFYPDGAMFVSLMTSGTNPYLEEIPPDGFSPANSPTKNVVSPMAACPCGMDGGWCYDMATGRILPDLGGIFVDPDGQPFCDY